MGLWNIPFQIRNIDKRVEKRDSFSSLEMHGKRTSLLGVHTLPFLHNSKEASIELKKHKHVIGTQEKVFNVSYVEFGSPRSSSWNMEGREESYQSKRLVGFPPLQQGL